MVRHAMHLDRWSLDVPQLLCGNMKYEAAAIDFRTSFRQGQDRQLELRARDLLLAEGRCHR